MRRRWQPKGWFTSLFGSRARNCSKMGSMKYDWMAGTGTRSFSSGSLSNSLDDQASRARPANGHAALLAEALRTSYGKDGDNEQQSQHHSLEESMRLRIS